MKTVLLFTLSFLFMNVMHAQTVTDTAVYKSVQVQAKFPGGADGWAKYLQHNLRAEVGAENLKVKKHHTERQTVIVSFLVDKAGKISEVTVANPKEVHPKLAEEAVRVIKVGPDWVPATINGEPVIYRQIQSITFEVSAE
jgi:protein TonB